MGAKFNSTLIGWTPVAVADTANFTDAGHHSLQGVTTPGTVNVLEVFLGGEATSSTVNQMVFGRDSTVGVTLSYATVSGYTAALHPSTAAARAVGFNTATTKPQKSSTLHLLSLSMNAFGGIIRWVAAPGEELTMIGITQPMGECSLTSVSGTGKLSSGIVFEEM